MFGQLSLNFPQQFFHTLNRALASHDLPAASSAGKLGNPLLADIHEVRRDSSGITVKFKVMFPGDDSDLSISEGDLTLRFQKDGTLYDSAMIKTIHGGRLFEGVIHATEHQWHIEWEED